LKTIKGYEKQSENSAEINAFLRKIKAFVPFNANSKHKGGIQNAKRRSKNGLGAQAQAARGKVRK